jgi:hypothetical protein
MPVCALTHFQVKQWEETGIRPDCRYHDHYSYANAVKKINKDEALDLTDRRAIIIYDCVKRYTWKGAVSGCTRVMLMKPTIRF